jgi:hypothetical protein
MNTNKVAYCIALGVLALGLNSEYRLGRFETLHQVADRAGFVLCRLSTRTERTLVAAGVLGHRKLRTDDFLASSTGNEMVRAERAEDKAPGHVREQLRAQADLIRAQVEMQRAQINEIRSAVRSQVRMARMVNRRVTICPKNGMQVVMSTAVESDDDNDSME